MNQATRLRPSAAEVATGTSLEYWARVTPDAVAVVDGQRQRTFKELNTKVNQIARALRRTGVNVDDGMALLSRNCLEWVEAYLAGARLGLQFTPLNWHSTAEEIGYILNDSKAKVALFDVESKDVAKAAVGLAPDLQTVLSIGEWDNGISELDRLAYRESGEALEEPAGGALFIYTSGTTGRPKGVRRDRESQCDFMVRSMAPDRTTSPLGIDYDSSRHRSLVTGPLFHGGPLVQGLVTPLLHGVGIVIMRRWDAKEFLRMVEHHRITHAHMVPIMFHRLLKLSAEERAAHDVTSLQGIIHGAAPCPVPTKRAMIDWLGPIIREYYGATEAGPGGVSIGSAEWLAHPGSVGRVVPPDYVKIADADGNWLPTNTVGRVCFLDYSNSGFEYYNDEAKTASAYVSADYFTVGDIGRIDDEGYLFLEDRDANLIISGGVNIYPAEIEAVLLEHESVVDAAVVGAPDAEWGEIPVAAIQLKRGSVKSAELIIAELRALCQLRLARYKTPKRFDFVQHLPRQDSGKLFKSKLREQYRNGAVQASKEPRR